MKKWIGRSRQTGFLLMSIVCAGVASAADYEAGQVWTYKARPGDQESRVLINLVETAPKGATIYHISLLRVRLPKLNGEGRGVTDMAHLPVSKATLDNSVVKLVGTREPFADYRGGYNEWRKAFDAGKGGVFKITIAEIADTIEARVLKAKDDGGAEILQK